MKNKWYNHYDFINYARENQGKEDYSVGEYIVNLIRKRRDFLIFAVKYTNKSSLKNRHKNEIVKLTELANTIATSKEIKALLESIEYIGE